MRVRVSINGIKLPVSSFRLDDQPDGTPMVIFSLAAPLLIEREEEEHGIKSIRRILLHDATFAAGGINVEPVQGELESHPLLALEERS